jgi:hypothetical protein
LAFLPYWSDADYIIRLLKNKYIICSKVFKKGEFVVHEKDKGKIIIGTFDLVMVLLNNSISDSNSDAVCNADCNIADNKKEIKLYTKIKEYKTNFNEIVKFMNSEVTNIKN